MSIVALVKALTNSEFYSFLKIGLTSRDERDFMLELAEQHREAVRAHERADIERRAQELLGTEGFEDMSTAELIEALSDPDAFVRRKLEAEADAILGRYGLDRGHHVWEEVIDYLAHWPQPEVGTVEPVLGLVRVQVDYWSDRDMFIEWLDYWVGPTWPLHPSPSPHSDLRLNREKLWVLPDGSIQFPAWIEHASDQVVTEEVRGLTTDGKPSQAHFAYRWSIINRWWDEPECEGEQADAVRQSLSWYERRAVERFIEYRELNNRGEHRISQEQVDWLGHQLSA